jgi:hypothetical protein
MKPASSGRGNLPEAVWNDLVAVAEQEQQARADGR